MAVHDFCADEKRGDTQTDRDTFFDGWVRKFCRYTVDGSMAGYMAFRDIMMSGE